MMKMRKGFTFVEFILVVLVFGFLLVVILKQSSVIRQDSRGRECQENLRKIDTVKDMWAEYKDLEEGAWLPNTWLEKPDICGPDGYIKHEPKCPSGGKYSVNNICTDPTCSIGTSNSPYTPHILPSYSY